MPQFLRLLVIQRVLISHGLDEIIFATHLLRPVRFIFYILPWHWFNKNNNKKEFKKDRKDRIANNIMAFIINNENLINKI